MHCPCVWSVPSHSDEGGAGIALVVDCPALRSVHRVGGIKLGEMMAARARSRDDTDAWCIAWHHEDAAVGHGEGAAELPRDGDLARHVVALEG